jgi:tetratricopeptide (TPR) repeat protein
MDHQRLDPAREHYIQARGVPAAEEAALDGLLKIHYLSSEWERALDCADRLIELDPGHARAHAMRADTLQALGRLDEGIAAAERALEFNPTLMPVREWLVNAQREAGRPAEADEQEETLLRMRGARPPAR